MTIEIPKEKWTEFFDDLSRRRFGWETRIEIMQDEIGDQILSEGLPLGGITFEEKNGKAEIEISVGETAESHQGHAIPNPQKVMYLSDGDFLGGVVEIEDQANTRTLVSLLNPMPVYLGYADYEIVMASGK